MSRPSLRFLLSLFCLALPGMAWGADCSPRATRLCLQGNRFQAEVAWTAPGFGSGAGQAVPLTGDTGAFWFFSNSNTELVVKVLDGRALNRHFWVFYGGLSDVEYTLTVTDTKTGLQEIYQNPAGKLASASDVTAFNAEDPAAAPPGPAAVLSPAGPLRLGPEFQVNVSTILDQQSPAVAIAPDGGFLIAWVGYSGNDLWSRLYDASGRPRGGEVRLDAGPFGPVQPRVAADASGNFLVVWSDTANTVHGRALNPSGQPVGGGILIAAGGTVGLGPPDVAAAPGGGFLVIWQELSTVYNVPVRIHTQRFDSQGARTAGENLFSTVGRASNVRMTPLPPDEFLASWSVVGTASSDVLAQRLDATGQAEGSPVPVALQTPGVAQGAVPVVYSGGGFSVVWTNGALGHPELTGLFGRRFAADGSPAGDAVQLRPGGSASYSEAVALPSGDTWALWFEYGLPLDLDGGLFSAVFDASWRSRGIARVNTWTQDFQIEPAAAVGPGGIVAVWSSGVPVLPILTPPHYGEGTEDGSFYGVFAQRFTTATCAAGSGDLCLNGRFRVAVQFTDPRSGRSGAAQPVPLTSDTGGFWFFDPGNVELIVKVLDGRAVNGHFWVYAGALSDVAYTITVTDTQTGKSKVYRNPAHRLASRADTSAF